MSSTRLFDVDPMNGITRLWHDLGDGQYAIEETMDAEQIIESNKRRLNDSSSRFGEGAVVGSVPMTVYAELRAKGILQDQKALRKWLNDRDNRVFRTHGGHL